MKKPLSPSQILFCILAVLALLVLLGFALLLMLIAAALLVQLFEQGAFSVRMIPKAAVLLACIPAMPWLMVRMVKHWKKAVFFNGVMCPVHQWDGGCTCRICGTTRNLNHHWVHCRCDRCGATRTEGHVWDGDTCTVCGLHRSAEENE